jgi:hypothetical protein
MADIDEECSKSSVAVDDVAEESNTMNKKDNNNERETKEIEPGIEIAEDAIGNETTIVASAKTLEVLEVLEVLDEDTSVVVVVAPEETENIKDEKFILKQEDNIGDLFSIDTPEEDMFVMDAIAEDETWERDVTVKNEKEMVVKDVVKDSSPIVELAGAAAKKSTISTETEKIKDKEFEQKQEDNIVDLFSIDTAEEDMFDMYASVEDEIWVRDVTAKNKKEMIVKDVVKDSSPIMGLVGATTKMSETSTTGKEKASSTSESPSCCSNSREIRIDEESMASSSMAESRSLGVSVPDMQPTESPSRIDSKTSTDKNASTQPDKLRETDKPSEVIIMKNTNTHNIMKKNTRRTKTATSTNFPRKQQQQKQLTIQKNRKDIRRAKSTNLFENHQLKNSIEMDAKKTKKSDHRSTAKSQKSATLFGKDTNERKNKEVKVADAIYKKRKAQKSTTLFGKDNEEGGNKERKVKDEKQKKRKAQMSTTLFGKNTIERENKERQAELQRNSKKKENKTNAERKTRYNM